MGKTQCIAIDFESGFNGKKYTYVMSVTSLDPIAAAAQDENIQSLTGQTVTQGFNGKVRGVI